MPRRSLGPSHATTVSLRFSRLEERRLPSINRRDFVPCFLRFPVNAFYRSVIFGHARKRKEHHGTELYIQTDHRTGTGRPYSFGSLCNCMGTNANAHAHANLHSPKSLHLFTHPSHRRFAVREQRYYSI